MAGALDAVRFVHFAAAMAVFGIGAFRLYAFAGLRLPAPGTAAAGAALDGLLQRLTAIGALAALLSALAIVPFTAAEMTGADAAALDPATWYAVLFATEFGRAWCWHLGFAAALLALCAVPRGRAQVRAATVAALLLLVSLGWVGHAAMDMGGGAAHVVNQMAHLTAGGVWLGGLVPLGVLLGRALRPGGEAYVPLARLALPHFSQMGYAAVALLAITGTVNGVLLVGSFHALLMTPYGRLLCGKLALFAAMVALALANRFRFVPRLRAVGDAMPPLRALYRSVLVEQALGVAILGIVAVLGTWPPAIEAMAGMKM
jgi:putative copper resistance protein D